LKSQSPWSGAFWFGKPGAGFPAGLPRSKLKNEPLGFHSYETMGRRDHYHVYVIELSKDVLYESRFRKANPDYLAGKPCVYVGMTGLDPDVRFDKHKAGIQSNRYVKQFGLRLLPELYEVYNPMPYDGARDMEVELAIGLREAGYGVWQA
jgi:hypothetical protein